MMRSVCFGLALASYAAVFAAETPVDAQLQPLKDFRDVIRIDIGVTRRGTKIPALITADDLDRKSNKHRILLVGGLDGSKAGVQTVIEVLRRHYSAKPDSKLRKNIAVSAVPIGNPDGWAAGKGPTNLSGGDPTTGYPPTGTAYTSKTSPESQYLGRFIGTHAPDEVWLFAGSKSGNLAAALQQHAPANVGRIAVMQIPDGGRLLEERRLDRTLTYVDTLFQLKLLLIDQQRVLQKTRRQINQRTVPKAESSRPNDLSARQQMRLRVQREPIEVARQLARHYGHELKGVSYIPALALIARLRLGELTDDPKHAADVKRIVAPYAAAENPKSAFGRRIAGSGIAGQLIFSELGRRAPDAKQKHHYLALARRGADLGFDESGKPKRSMPAHSEMSDAVFMGCPILVQTGRLTGETKYYDLALVHLRFMQAKCLRGDGLYRHSPLDETAWGRGNGFPALGLALCLSDLPEEHAAFAPMLASFRSHMTAMVKHQDPTGMWHQVVDHTGSYRELTVTCMTTFAMLRGMRRGWLDRKAYGPVVQKAWPAISARIGTDGSLIDVCTGTGKQKNLRAYLDRPAILGRDARGGAMALLVATEMAAFNAKPESRLNR